MAYTGNNCFICNIKGHLHYNFETLETLLKVKNDK